MTNIVIIADKSEAYVNFERDRVIKDWGAQWADTRSIQNITEAGEVSLFGDASISILELSEKEAVKVAAENLKGANQSELTRWSTPGLIMLTTVDRNSTKGLEKAVADKGGIVILAKESSKDKTPPAQRLVDELNLSRDVKTFLKDFAGDDYSSILSLVKTLSELSPRQQQGITIDDLLVRLPQAPGAIPPWELEPAILKGDITRAIELYRRLAKTSHLLVVLAILKNKFNLVFKVASVLEANPGMNLAQLASTLGVPNNYPLRLAHDSAKRMGQKSAANIIELMAETEKKVKGGAAGNPHVTMETMIVRVSAMARR